jgi:hypothetical protein
MIVGSVSTEVYRRIEEYTRKGPGADAAAKEESIVAAAAKPATEQNTNATGTLVTAATSSAPATAPATAPDGKPASAANPVSASAGKPENTSAAPPNPWDALRVGAHVIAKYWEKDGSANGWWLAIITAIDKNDFIVRWPDEPKTPPLKIERKHVAILHSAFDPSSEWVRRREITTTEQLGRPLGRPFSFCALPKPGDRDPSPGAWWP